MKTEINLQELKDNLNLDYSELLQISDDSNGRVRLIGYLSDLPISREKRWFITSETITIDSLDNSILKIETTKFKNRDWIFSNDSLVIVRENFLPVSNPDFNGEEEITLENSPYLLNPAFDFYYGLRHSRVEKVDFPEMFDFWVNAIDKWGYFDKKENHIELIDVIKVLYEQQPKKKVKLNSSI